MRLHYLDSSALVKAYVPELGTDRVRDVLRTARVSPGEAQVVVSRLAYPETLSAVTRRENAGDVEPGEADFIVRQVRRDFTGPEQPYAMLDAAASIVEHAADLVRHHHLRGFDAVHLASALAVSAGMSADDALVFVCADGRLRAAAGKEGLTTIDPEEERE